MPSGLLVFLNGISGVGKTTVFHILKEQLPPSTYYFVHLDGVEGTPSTLEEMAKQAGSPEKWQEQFIYKQVFSATQTLPVLKKKIILMDGQANFQFIERACRDCNLAHLIILLVASWQVVQYRLLEQRGQPELVNTSMKNWATFLRLQAQERGTPIITTDDKTPQEVAFTIQSFIHNLNFPLP